MIYKLVKGIIDPIMAFFLGGIEILIFYIRQHIFGNTIPNYIAVKDARLYRGGQPSVAGLRTLMKGGIATVVNLRAGNRDKRTISKFFDGRLHLIHVPIIPFHPRESSVIEFLKIFTGTNSGPVYVHCFHGADRTGLMCAMYRLVFDDWDKPSAILEMRKNGFHFWHRKIITYIENSDVEALKKKVFSP
jgi:tyrosine-protein phosphatase SIW14